MDNIERDASQFGNLASKTAIVTGAANGIGAQIVRLFNTHGANVVMADLESARASADAVIASLSDPSTATFVPTDILDWGQMKTLFRDAVARHGSVEIVVANAGVMESRGVFDMTNVDERGELRESTEGFRTIDVNLKGTLNTLRLALHHMQSNAPCFPDSSRGSVVLISSTSGYVGGTGVGGYVASKHGVTGLLRASQLMATELGVKVNAVAPFVTPTHITAGFIEQWTAAGLKANTSDDVACAVAQTAMSPGSGECCLIVGKMMREVENTRKSLMPDWFGNDVADLLGSAGKLFAELGGFPLPRPRAL